MDFHGLPFQVANKIPGFGFSVKFALVAPRVGDTGDEI